MLSVDRADFCPENSYLDCPQSIGYNATISAPHMHAYALEVATPYLPELKANKILDIGSGSGYLTACFAKLGGANSKVVGVEHVPELVEASIKNTNRHHQNLISGDRVEFVRGDGRLGYPIGGPYQVIHVGAACKEYPARLVDQLANDGILIAPVGTQISGQTINLIRKDSDGNVSSEETIPVAYVPLTDLKRQI